MRDRRSLSLQVQLPLAAAVLLILLAGALTLVAHHELRRQARRLATARLTNVMDRLSASTAASIPRSLDLMRRASEDPRVIHLLGPHQPGDTVGLAATLARAVGASDSLSVVVVWDLEQNPVVAFVGGDSTGLPDWATPPELVDSARVMPFEVGRDSAVTYDVVSPVREGRRLVGFLQRRSRVVQSAQATTTVAALLGEEGHLLLGSTNGVWTDLAHITDPIPDTAIGSQEAVGYTRAGARQLGIGRAIPGSPWMMAVELPEAAALASTGGLLARLALIAAILVVLVTLAAWHLGRGITLPLRALRQSAEAIRAGDYGHRAVTAGHPELLDVAAAFNEMAVVNARHIADLEAKEQRFRSLVTATAQIVWWTDAEGQVRDPSPAWQAYTGQDVGAALGAGWVTAVHPEDAGRAVRIWTEAIEHRSLYETEYRIRRHDGEYRWFLARAVPVLGRSGAINEWVGTYTDTTDRRVFEDRLRRKEDELRQAQRLDAIGRLAGGIAHDFNNLLTAILVPAELAIASLPDDAPLKRDLEEIREAGARAAELTHQLLAFGRQQVLAPEVVEVDGVVRAASKLLKRVLPESVALHLALDSRDSTVRVDRSQLEQVLINLAVNSRDAMPDGGSLTIESQPVVLSREFCERHEGIQPGRFVMLAVTDTGIGMDDATRNQVFEPFYTTKPVGKGTGLGLSTVYGIVRQSGGHIWLYSEPGKGTTVKVYFPETTDAPTPAPDTETETVPLGSATILLAEDDPAIRRIGERLLGMLGYTVHAASSGETALEIAHALPGTIDLLVTDMVMPGMNGMELWERLRRSQPNLPALFVSGWAGDAVVRHRILDGEVPFLQKPFTMESLGRKVHEVLNSRRPD
jgi:PAS domain S-box-containing protein